MERRLYRDTDRKVIGGVCAGLADYFDVDVALVRVIFILALIMKGGGGLLYIILWIVLTPKTDINPVVDFSAMPPPPEPLPVKKTVSTPSLVIGLVFIMFGIYFLLDQYNLIPDLDLDKFWPIVLIVIGLVLMMGFWKRNRVDEQPEGTLGDDTKEKDNKDASIDNPENL